METTAGQTTAWQITARQSALHAAAVPTAAVPKPVAPVAAATGPAGAGIEPLELPGMVSLWAEVPEPLLHSMRGFIEAHPNWDQYRLFQAALAGFLVQNGVQSREITRCYLANLFPQQPRFAEPL
jgi:hypothetical protein